MTLLSILLAVLSKSCLLPLLAWLSPSLDCFSFEIDLNVYVLCALVFLILVFILLVVELVWLVDGRIMIL